MSLSIGETKKAPDITFNRGSDEDIKIFANYAVPATDIGSGTATSGTTNSLTDTTKTWTVNQHVDKVVKISDSTLGIFEYALVLSNTSNTLVFDDVLLTTPVATNAYRILNTYPIEYNKLDTIVAMDVRENCGAVVLPVSNEDIERNYAHIYNERALNGDHHTIVMCRGTERQLGNKYGTLEHRYEGVRLHAHTWLTPHWDVLQTYNIKRFASAYWSVDEPITTTDFAYLGDTTKLVLDKKKRFTSIDRSGKRWIKYTSLVPSDFHVTFNCLVSKTDGGNSVIEFSLAKYDYETDTITEMTERIGVIRLSVAGEGTVSVTMPVSLTHNDEIICIARRSAGTIVLQTGSSIEISEL